ncbi:DUF3072 domain-containing protein [Jiella sonneratiae]|uniref:DUF3072 domain-containing protein n=1 Tax=Jiella sonneratiae TaxID=2816856 RepID=A0ABS3JCU1_9HYPH|nr:DUF3072 domain-containing protein [Jiella sonneratiae]MBO0906386.1 DUF3072 domain-containing protein [Jiella sonneratiae]
MSNVDAKADTGSNTEKDPAEWTTGGEPMTGAQASYLKTLCEETGHPFDETLTKADASKLIDLLQGESKRISDAES